MEKDKSSEKEKKPVEGKTEKWIEKANDYMDEAADKIHKSETYKKADQSVEKATKKLFRGAGKIWGKSERYFKKKTEEGENKK